jgi:hypothetical protein
MLDSRSSQRVKLARPIEGFAGALSLLLVDASGTGLQVHHREPLPAKGTPFVLRFSWNGLSIELECVVVWTAIHRLAKSTSERPVLSSGLRVVAGDERSERLFQEMIQFAGQASTNPNAGPARYLFCELVDGTWRQVRTAGREQPAEGFTVSSTEDPSQVERLCTAYAGGDGETRKLIRTLAALSIRKQDQATPSS